MTNQSQVDGLKEIEIEKLDESSKQTLDDWLLVVWEIFDELQNNNEK